MLEVFIRNRSQHISTETNSPRRWGVGLHGVSQWHDSSLAEPANIYSMLMPDLRAGFLLLPLSGLIFNVVIYHFQALLNIIKIECFFLVSLESIGRHDVIPAMTYLSMIYCDLSQWCLYNFNPHSWVDGRLWMREIGKESLRSVAQSVQPYQWAKWFTIADGDRAILNVSIDVRDLSKVHSRVHNYIYYTCSP